MSTASVSRSSILLTIIEVLIYKIHQHPLVAYLDLYLGIKLALGRSNVMIHVEEI